MPGKLKAKIVAGRHLPVMDRASELTDAFVEVEDEDLQDEPLQVTVLDHDTYSANDAIGKVYIDIDPLLCSEAASVISGWFPIYDTIHGELQRKIGLKVLEMGGNAVVGYLQCFDLEGESGLVVRAIGTACTLEKLSSGSAPSTTTHVHPNTAPASNACNSPSKDGKDSQRLTQNFSVSVPTLVFTAMQPPVLIIRNRPQFDAQDGSPTLSLRGAGTVGCGKSSAPRAATSPLLSSVRSDPTLLRKSVSFTEDLLLGASGMGSGGSAGKEPGPLKTLLRQQTQTALEQREFPFFTLTSFPPAFLVHVGGVVSARSVKLLDRIHNPGSRCAVHNDRSAFRNSCHRKGMLYPGQSATGVYLTALPAPGGIQIAGKTPSDLSNEHHVLTIQRRINDTIAKNKEIYQINPPVRQREFSWDWSLLYSHRSRHTSEVTRYRKLLQLF
ncbi:unnamed protein product [Tetraodon nigroviridis]|uniref:(spotted green pufferfish) hypothetical protein n=1 Tax=Tetraodon nigroviridis TaxID=99883 RepID=Q4REX7_TETNG|nr:unnamed protein product [Tetraodon nigroviridis]